MKTLDSLSPEEQEHLFDVVAEYLRRVDNGERVDRRKLMWQNPTIAEALEAYFETSDMVDQMAGPTVQESALVEEPTHSAAMNDTVSPSQEERICSDSTPMPKEFGRYRIKRKLGEGAMGAVYLAFDTQLERKVALKTPSFENDATGDLLQRFYREAKSAGLLRHPGICPVHDVGEINGIHYISMSYIEGRQLSSYITVENPQDERKIVLLVRKLALALDEAHQNGVTHRDLKPANIMVDRRNEPVVMDFGLAYQSGIGEEFGQVPSATIVDNANPRHTKPNTILGSPAYMSPEQVESRLDDIGPATDIYCLGVVFYQLLTGRLPFNGSLAVVLSQIVAAAPQPPTTHRPDLDPRLELICLKMMSKRIEDRYNSMDEVADALTQIVKETKLKPDQSKTPSLAPFDKTEIGVGQSLLSRVAANRKSAGMLMLVVLVPLLALAMYLATSGDSSDSNSKAESPPGSDGNSTVSSDPGGNPEPSKPLDFGEVVRRVQASISEKHSQEPANAAGDELPLQAPLQPPNDPSVLADATAEIEAFSGQHFGVCRISVTYRGENRPVLLPDQTVWLHEQKRRSHYPTFASEAAGEKDLHVKQLTAYCLFAGDEPLRLRLTTEDTFTKSFDSDRPEQDDKAHQRLLKAWWASYTRRSQDQYLTYSQHSLADAYLKTMLARRLNLPTENIAEQAAVTNLLGGENAIGQLFHLLLGTASLRAAMQTNTLLNVNGNVQPPTLPLPKPVAPPAIVLPDGIPKDVPIEEIATCVPEECFYVRCGTYENYRWLRQTLQEWGGNLNQLIAMHSVDHGIHQRMEQQLALKENETMRLFADGVIADMAIIGTDTFFREGAAIGVLFQVDRQALKGQANDALAAMIRQQREAAKRRDGAREETITLAGHDDVSFLRTDDNSVRSFYVAEGDFHLLTTSQYIASRFLAAAAGKRSLAGLEEFRYARSVKPLSGTNVAFIYLSDPFFRNLVGPKYRIEMTRRTHALGSLEVVELGRLAAVAEGIEADNVPGLIQANLLPASFGSQPDGSQPVLKDGRVTDSLRGGAGSFMPVPDVSVAQATPAEVAAYQKFAGEYRQQWQQMDPVIIAITRKKLQDPGRQQIVLDVSITPYARRLYESLQMYSAFLAPNRRQISHVSGDLLTLEVPLSLDGKGRSHLMAGLRDFTIPYSISRGMVYPLLNCDFSAIAIQKLLESGGYLAGEYHKDFEQLGVQDVEGYRQDAGRLPQPVWQRGWLNGSKWTALSRYREILEQVTPHLNIVPAARPAQLRLRLESLSETQLGDVVRALAYSHARRISGGNTQLLHQLMQQFHLDPDQARQAAENRLLRAKLNCPLGGRYEQRVMQSGAVYWGSTRWTTRSAYSVNEIPQQYRFGFLDWLHRMNIEFNLSANTLAARIALEVQQADDKRNIDYRVQNPPIPIEPPDEEIPATVWAAVFESLRMPEAQASQKWAARPAAERTKIAPSLISILDSDTNVHIRLRGLQMLSQVEEKPPNYVPVLLKLLQDERQPAGLRIEIVKTLGKHSPFNREAVIALVDLSLGELDSSLQSTVWQALSNIDSDGALSIPLLIQDGLHSDREEVQLRAVMVLRKHGVVARDAVSDLATLLDDSSDPRLRRAAAETLGAVGTINDPVVQKLIDATQDEDESVRVAAVTALRQVTIETTALRSSARTSIVTAIENDTSAVRIAAIRTLVKLGDSSSMSTLIGVALNDANGAARDEAATTLGKRFPSTAAEAIWSMIKSAGFSQPMGLIQTRQVAALRRMGEASDAAIAVIVRRIILERDVKFRFVLVRIIESMNSRARATAIKKLTVNSRARSNNQRYRAKWAIRQLSKPNRGR